MDGGRIGAAISPYFGLAGLATGGALIAYGHIHNPIFYLIMLGGSYSTATRLFGWTESETAPNYYDIGGQAQAGIFGAYATIVGLLLALIQYNNSKRLTPKQLQSGESRESSPSEGLMIYDDYFDSSVYDEN